MNVQSSPIITMAAKIAMTHHEKWDGTGYPIGLKGEDTLAGRIRRWPTFSTRSAANVPTNPPSIGSLFQDHGGRLRHAFRSQGARCIPGLSRGRCSSPWAGTRGQRMISGSWLDEDYMRRSGRETTMWRAHWKKRWPDGCSLPKDRANMATRHSISTIDVTSPSLPNRAISDSVARLWPSNVRLALAPRPVDDPLLIANGDAETNGHLRRHGASDSATVSCRQVMRRRKRLRSRSMNNGAKSRCPAVLCRSSRPCGDRRQTRRVCSARHSGIPSGSTWASGRHAADFRLAVAPGPVQESLAALVGPAEFDLGQPRARRCDIPNCRAAGSSRHRRGTRTGLRGRARSAAATSRRQSARSPVPDSPRLGRYTSNSIPSAIPAGVAGPAG